MILVGYATLYGSTQEVAEEIAAILRVNGYQTQLKALGEVESLDRYESVVLGAPLYISKWHKEMQNFLTNFQDELMQRPVAIFTLGPISTDEKEMQGTRKQLDKQLERYPWLKPVAVQLFVGKFDPAKLNFMHRAMAILPASPLHGLPPSDNRDWDAIHAWAGSLPDKL